MQKTLNYTHLRKCSHTHMHTQYRYINGTQNAMLIPFYTFTQTHTHTHTDTEHLDITQISTYCSAYSIPYTVGLHCSFKSCLRRSCRSSANAPGLWLNSDWSGKCECASSSNVHRQCLNWLVLMHIRYTLQSDWWGHFLAYVHIFKSGLKTST